jgi:membrane fusion protein (multidrug efflux system)
VRPRASKYLLGTIAIVALTAVGSFVYFHDAEGTLPTKAPESTRSDVKKKQRGIPVEVARVVSRDLSVDISAVGTLQPNEAIVVQPEVAGRIARFGFEEGAKVGKGDVLVELDPDILKAEFARAQSDLRLAIANYERTNTLARQGSATLRARDEARAALDAARANRELADARLKRATIRAPFPGIVGLRRLSVGEYVSVGTRIVELADIDPIKVDFRVPEVNLISIRRDQLIVLTVDARPGESFDGRLYAIDPIVDENGRAIRLRATVANPEHKLSPGLFARVRIIVEIRRGALLVPESAVFSDKDKKFVYRVVDGRAVLTEVHVGMRRPGEVEILTGLDASAQVVTAGQQQVRDGSALQILQAKDGG